MADSIRDIVLRRILTSSGRDEAPSNNEDLFTSGLLDSLSFMTFLVSIRKDLGISFDRADLRFENFSTLDQIVERVEKRQKELQEELLAKDEAKAKAEAEG